MRVCKRGVRPFFEFRALSIARSRSSVAQYSVLFFFWGVEGSAAKSCGVV